jgi:MFS family permease
MLSTLWSRHGRLIVVSSGIMLDVIVYGVIVPLLPRFQELFELTDLQLGVLMSSFSLAALALQPFAGLLSDRTSERKWPLVIGAGVLALSTLLYSVAASYAWLVATRCVQGAASAITWTVGLAAVHDAYSGHSSSVSNSPQIDRHDDRNEDEDDERVHLVVNNNGDGGDGNEKEQFLGTAMAIVSCSASVGALLGEPLGGWLYHWSGSFHLGFYVCAGAALVETLIIALFYGYGVKRQRVVAVNIGDDDHVDAANGEEELMSIDQLTLILEDEQALNRQCVTVERSDEVSHGNDDGNNLTALERLDKLEQALAPNRYWQPWTPEAYVTKRVRGKLLESLHDEREALEGAERARSWLSRCADATRQLCCVPLAPTASWWRIFLCGPVFMVMLAQIVPGLNDTAQELILPLFLDREFNLSEAAIGSVFGVMAVSGALGSIGMGIATDRGLLSRNTVFAIGMATVALLAPVAGLRLTDDIGRSAALAVEILAIVALAFGMGCTHIVMAMIGDVLDALQVTSHVGLLYGVGTSMFTIGMIVGPNVSSAILHHTNSALLAESFAAAANLLWLVPVLLVHNRCLRTVQPQQ